MIVVSHGALIKVSLALAIVTILSSVIAVGSWFRSQPVNHYFATTDNGRLIALTPLNQPMMNLKSVEDFASRVISSTFTFDYANYKKQIGGQGNNYTQAAFSAIRQSLVSTQGIVTQAIKNSWVVTANVMASPTVIKQGQRPDGKYGWTLRFPVRLTYQSESDVRTSDYTAQVVVIRVKQTNDPKGIAINQLTLTPAGGTNE